MVNLKTPIGQLTGEEFLELIGRSVDNQKNKEVKNYVYGIAGLAKIANCSLPTAQKLKNSGLVPFSQAGRKIIFDIEAVLNALSKSKENKK